MARFRVQVANAMAQVYEKFVVYCAEEDKDINSLKEFMWFCSNVVDADIQTEPLTETLRKTLNEMPVCTCPLGGMRMNCPQHGVKS